MIVGIGVDIVELERFQGKLDDTPALLERIFTPSELNQASQSLAGCWAAKEAVIKALGNPVGLSWQDVSVVKDERGKPFLDVSGETHSRAQSMGVTNWHLSISHDGGMACAMVVAEAGA